MHCNLFQDAEIYQYKYV